MFLELSILVPGGQSKILPGGAITIGGPPKVDGSPGKKPHKRTSCTKPTNSSCTDLICMICWSRSWPFKVQRKKRSRRPHPPPCRLGLPAVAPRQSRSLPQCLRCSDANCVCCVVAFVQTCAKNVSLMCRC